MTEISYTWTTGGGGDDAAIARDDWDDLIQVLLGGPDWTSEGVVAGYENDLAVSNPSGQTVRVATGAAVVDGKPYRNTADVDNVLTTPSVGDTGFRVVLRKSWSAQTVRVAVLQNTDGNSAAPAVTQTDGTTWEISLATGTITTGGVVTVTDDRSYLAAGGAPNGRLVAIGNIAGADGAATNDFGIDSSSRTGTGTYSITFEQEVKHVFCQQADTAIATNAGPAIGVDTVLPATTITVLTYANATTLGDRDFHVVAYA